MTDTAKMIAAEPDRRSILPAELICRLYFTPLTYPVFLRKLERDDIDLVVTRMGSSQKAPRVVHAEDMARHIAGRRKVARRERKAMRSA